MNIRSKDELSDYVNYGSDVTYLFFWGHREARGGITHACFSQWYDAPFVDNAIRYATAEHYMMAEKARLFSDEDAARRVVAASNPGDAKQIGRQIEGFDEQIWCRVRFQIVIKANLLKFSQHKALQAFLLSTGDRVIVEASPHDRIWGIGLVADDPAATNPNLWKGLNLLGFALMEVRARLASDGIGD